MLFPYALFLGMDYHLFWHEDPLIINGYVKRQELNLRVKEQEMEYQAWLAGSYVLEAVSVVMEHAFAKNARSQYPQTPRKTPTERLKEQRELEKGTRLDPAVQLFHAQFERWSDTFNSKQ